MSTNQEEKIELLAHAIIAGELESVRELVEVRGCRVKGPGPWEQVPLAISARYGRLDIIDYLIRTRRGAIPDSSTLRAAIKSGKPEVITHLLTTYDLEWTACEYEFAFASGHLEILKYAFESAIDHDCFEFPHVFDEENYRWRIILAAREAVASTSGSFLFEEIMHILRTRNQGQLFYINSDGNDYEFLFDTIEHRPESFAVVWALAHQSLFGSSRYADLDNYTAKAVVDELFFSAITLRQNRAFYTLLQYALPHFKQAIDLARSSDNSEVAEFLTRYCE
jgi:hypothetical protein